MFIHVIDKFDTTLGLILCVDPSLQIKKYDFIVDDDGNEYIPHELGTKYMNTTDR